MLISQLICVNCSRETNGSRWRSVVSLEESSQVAEVGENENATAVALGNEQFAGSLVQIQSTRIIQRLVQPQRQNSGLGQSRVQSHHRVAQTVGHQHAPSQRSTALAGQTLKGFTCEPISAEPD